MPPEQHAYENVLDACRGLLVDVCVHLNAIKTNYVIAGGWVPYLRSVHPRFQHQGTKDVDVLLDDDRELLKPAVHALLNAGYLLSAKHSFQLLRILNVRDIDGGQVHELAFNVDLMHPAKARQTPEMFADIMEININQAYDPGKVHVQSIVFPSSKIIFDERMWEEVELAATSPAGESNTSNVPLLTPAAFILSKCDSVRNKKRERDAFDIYFVLTGQRGEETIRALRSFAEQFPQVDRQLGLLHAFLRERAGVFDENVARYTNDWMPRESPARVVRVALFRDES